MKKTNKLVIISIIAILVALLSFNVIYAHTVELDPDSLISFPSFIWGGEGKITIKSTETNYKLYWQPVEISSSDYKKIEEVQSTGKKKLTDIESQMKELKTECENLKTTLDTKSNEYKQAISDKASESEIAAAKTAYDEALKNYNDKVGEYNTKVKEYNTKAKELNDSVKELIPGYVESNWIETKDTSFKVDLSKFSGERVFVVWAKLDSNGKVSYDEVIYTMSGTKSEEIKVTAVSINKSELTIEEGNNYLLSATVTPNDATNKDIEWSSDNEEVATIEKGQVTAVKEGTATITAKTKDGEYTATCKVTVTKKSAEPSKEEDKKDDNTTADKQIPQTGTKATMSIVLASMVVIGIAGYLGYRRYNGIK